MLKRRDFLKTCGAGLACLTLPEIAFPETSSDTLPNIVLILVDDLGWSGLGCYGNEFHETPSIDELAQKGMRFTNAYAASPVCSPTRASIMTGKYPATLGITDWIPGQAPRHYEMLKCPEPVQQLAAEETTLAEALKSVGYTTASVGKWHLGGKGFLPESQGFDVNVAGTHLGYPDGGYFLPNRMDISDAAPGEYLTDYLTTKGIEFIESNQNRPFFLYQSYHSVHSPIQAPQKIMNRYRDTYWRRYLRQGKNRDMRFDKYTFPYAAMVHSLDKATGRIMRTLQELHLAERTVVIFMSDNGGSFWYADQAPLRAGKGYLYEGGIRVPMIIRAPSLSNGGNGGQLCDVPVSSVDLYPTILEFAGITSRNDGASLRPLVQGNASLNREALYWHYPHYSPHGSPPCSAVRKGDYKLIQFYEDNHIELYNVNEDISEIHEISRNNPEKAVELQQMLQHWLIRTQAKLPELKPGYRK